MRTQSLIHNPKHIAIAAMIAMLLYTLNASFFIPMLSAEEPGVHPWLNPPNIPESCELLPVFFNLNDATTYRFDNTGNVVDSVATGPFPADFTYTVPEGKHIYSVFSGGYDAAYSLAAELQDGSGATLQSIEYDLTNGDRSRFVEYTRTEDVVSVHVPSGTDIRGISWLFVVVCGADVEEVLQLEVEDEEDVEEVAEAMSGAHAILNPPSIPEGCELRPVMFNGNITTTYFFNPDGTIGDAVPNGQLSTDFNFDLPSGEYLHSVIAGGVDSVHNNVFDVLNASDEVIENIEYTEDQGVFLRALEFFDIDHGQDAVSIRYNELDSVIGYVWLAAVVCGEADEEENNSSSSSVSSSSSEDQQFAIQEVAPLALVPEDDGPEGVDASNYNAHPLLHPPAVPDACALRPVYFNGNAANTYLFNIDGDVVGNEPNGVLGASHTVTVDEGDFIYSTFYTGLEATNAATVDVLDASGSIIETLSFADVDTGDRMRMGDFYDHLETAKSVRLPAGESISGLSWFFIVTCPEGADTSAFSVIDEWLDSVEIPASTNIVESMFSSYPLLHPPSVPDECRLQVVLFNGNNANTYFFAPDGTVIDNKPEGVLASDHLFDVLPGEYLFSVYTVGVDSSYEGTFDVLNTADATIDTLSYTLAANGERMHSVQFYEDTKDAVSIRFNSGAVISGNFVVSTVICGEPEFRQDVEEELKITSSSSSTSSVITKDDVEEQKAAEIAASETAPVEAKTTVATPTDSAHRGSQTNVMRAALQYTYNMLHGLGKGLTTAQQRTTNIAPIATAYTDQPVVTSLVATTEDGGVYLSDIEKKMVCRARALVSYENMRKNAIASTWMASQLSNLLGRSTDDMQAALLTTDCSDFRKREISKYGPAARDDNQEETIVTLGANQ